MCSMNRREMLKLGCAGSLAAMTSTVPGVMQHGVGEVVHASTSAIEVTNGPRSRFKLTLTVRVILEALLERDTKRDCHLESSLKRRRILVLLDGNHGLACDADSIGKFLLRHLPRGPKFSNPVAYSGHQRALR
jgi:hypothetical protein